MALPFKAHFLKLSFRGRVALNVNADEAAVLGAALHGASLSSQFRTKPIKITDIGVHDIQIGYFAAAPAPNIRPRSITSVVFPAGSKVGTRKVMTFKKREDFTIYFDYKYAPATYVYLLSCNLRADKHGGMQWILNSYDGS